MKPELILAALAYHDRDIEEELGVFDLTRRQIGRILRGRREPELAAAVKEIGKNVTGVQGDVASLGDLNRLFVQINREKGKLDIVFANAGIAMFASLGTITEEHYSATKATVRSFART